MPSNGDAALPVKGIQPIAKSVSNDNMDLSIKGEEEECGDEWERRCYLLGQGHGSWEVWEREAGKWLFGWS